MKVSFLGNDPRAGPRRQLGDRALRPGRRRLPACPPSRSAAAPPAAASSRRQPGPGSQARPSSAGLATRTRRAAAAAGSPGRRVMRQQRAVAGRRGLPRVQPPPSACIDDPGIAERARTPAGTGSRRRTARSPCPAGSTPSPLPGEPAALPGRSATASRTARLPRRDHTRSPLPRPDGRHDNDADSTTPRCHQPGTGNTESANMAQASMHLPPQAKKQRIGNLYRIDYATGSWQYARAAGPRQPAPHQRLVRR